MKYSKLQLEAILLGGEQYLRNGMESEAFEAFSTVFTHIPWDTHNEDLALLERAYKGIQELHSHRNEYIWEEASQLIGDYHNYVQNKKTLH